ncbi:LPXTG cell wall anchor domain-containing protein [Clostridium sporogenes]|uniref:SpaA isopeptide-forming pilin-related protein n=1 Tax=Clostridium sporogenes TaxID=1509 RepID=UPI002237CD87|nr:SpaA isopeptide-forming pilin-related protein [Clostridium sporogenes]MCW6092469.1 LPXTG cell wall anchor domain-containing protein [Clostridium sporogenes]
MNKLMKFFVVIFMITNIFFNSYSVNAETPEGQKNSSILDNLNITHEDGSDKNQWYTWERVNLNYEWSLKDHKKGDVEEFDLPKEFQLENGLHFNIKTNEGVLIQKVHADKNGHVKVELVDPTNYIETHGNIHGNMYFTTKFNKDIINEPGKYPISLDNNISTEPIEIIPEYLPNKDEKIYKWGTVNKDDGIIKWVIRVNYAQAEINNAIIKEELGEGQNYIEGSVKISQVTFNHNTGNYDECIDVTDKFNMNENNTGFNIDLGNINKGYIIKFNSKITNSNQIIFSNTVRLDGDNIEEKFTKVEAKSSEGGGKAAGINDPSVILTKVDSDTKEVLKDAEFSLQNKMGIDIKIGLKTDENGQIHVKGLVSGEYQFVETKAPNGYKLDKTPIKFTIKDGQIGDIRVNKENTAIPGNVILTKIDSSGKKALEGAEFSLQNKSGKDIKIGLKTDKNGQIYVKDLVPGEYQFVETKAPNGYKLDKNPVKFTVKVGQTNTLNLIKYNEALGKIQKKLLDSGENKPMQPDNKLIQENSKIMQSNNKLPRTGYSFNFIMLGIGFILISIASIFLIRRQKQLRSK